MTFPDASHRALVRVPIPPLLTYHVTNHLSARYRRVGRSHLGRTIVGSTDLHSSSGVRIPIPKKASVVRVHVPSRGLEEGDQEELSVEEDSVEDSSQFQEDRFRTVLERAERVAAGECGVEGVSEVSESMMQGRSPASTRQIGFPVTVCLSLDLIRVDMGLTSRLHFMHPLRVFHRSDRHRFEPSNLIFQILVQKKMGMFPPILKQSVRVRTLALPPEFRVPPSSTLPPIKMSCLKRIRSRRVRDHDFATTRRKSTRRVWAMKLRDCRVLLDSFRRDGVGELLAALRSTSRHRKSILSRVCSSGLLEQYVKTAYRAGLLLDNLGRFSEAIRFYKQILAILPTFDAASTLSASFRTADLIPKASSFAEIRLSCLNGLSLSRFYRFLKTQDTRDLDAASTWNQRLSLIEGIDSSSADRLKILVLVNRSIFSFFRKDHRGATVDMNAAREIASVLKAGVLEQFCLLNVLFLCVEHRRDVLHRVFFKDRDLLGLSFLDRCVQNLVVARAHVLDGEFDKAVSCYEQIVYFDLHALEDLKHQLVIYMCILKSQRVVK